MVAIPDFKADRPSTEVVTKWGQGDENIEQSGVTNLKGGLVTRPPSRAPQPFSHCCGEFRVHGPQVVRGVYCHIVDLKFERGVLAFERLPPRHILADNPARLYEYQGCAADWGRSR
jgi:hypothetical protein